MAVAGTVAAQEVGPTPTPAPTFDDGFRDGVQAAREKPVWDWAAIGGGASLVTSGCAAPFVGCAPFVIERPRIIADGADESQPPAYLLGYGEGYEITVKRRRAAAAWVGGVTTALVLAAGLGIVNYRNAERERRENGEEASAPPALLRF